MTANGGDDLPTTGAPDAPPALAEDASAKEPFRARGAVWILIAFLLGQLLGALVAGLGYGVYAGSVLDLDAGEIAHRALPYATLGALIASALVTYLVADRVIRKKGGETFEQAIDWSVGPAKGRAIGAAVGAALAALYLGSAVVFPPDAELEGGPMAQMAVEGGIPRLAWSVLALAAPFLEEFLFRGALFTGMKRSWDGTVAGIFTAAVFVVAHITEIQGYLPAFLAISALAILTQQARSRFRSLGPAVAVHLAYNGVIVIGAWILV